MTLPNAFLGTPIAHRGLHDRTAGRPENSMAAIRAAVEAGYGVEIDIQAAGDGVPLAFHDYDLVRMAGQEVMLKFRNTADLEDVRLLETDEGIPTLADVLDLVAGRAPLLIEIKDQTRVMGYVDEELEYQVAKILESYDGPVAVMSFNPHSVAAFGAAAPDIPRGIVTGSYGDPEWAPLGEARLEALKAISDFDRVGASFISHDRADLNDHSVAELKARGVPVLCWTVKSAEQEVEARLVADNITFEGYLA